MKDPGRRRSGPTGRAEGKPAPPRARRGRPPRWVRIVAPILAALLAVLVLGIAEAVLRLADYGVPGNLFEESGIPGYLILHNDYYRRFHPRTEPSPTPRAQRLNPVLMAHPKPDDVVRIFVIGGSTAKGFPHHDLHGFAGIAGALLESRLNGRRVEVVNLARSAMSSYYVRETAGRSWRHDPDLVLVYSGHNEYFGTIGAGTGRGHRRKLLYMSVKELRVFQWLFNRLQPGTSGAEPGDQPMTLMARRLAIGGFPKDDELDRIVAERFIDNLEAVRRGARKRGIPLVVIDPVCNLLDMPPFDGLHAAGLEDLIDSGTRAVDGGEDARTAWLRAAAAEPGAADNAHVLYLSARMSPRDGEDPLHGFTAAKDADLLPFRAREVLRAALADWADKHTGSVHFIPLHREIEARRGPGAFGDSLFIDHLHFSHRGQLLAGRITAEHLLELVAGPGLSPGNWPTDDEIRERLQYHPAMDLSASMKVWKLLHNPPFHGMRIPYRAEAVSSALEDNPLMQEHELRERLISSAPDRELAVIGEYLRGSGRNEELVQLLNALASVNPGSHHVHHNLAGFLAGKGSRQPQLLGAYQRAYLLSGRDAGIRSEMNEFADRAGLGEDLERFYVQIKE